MESQTLPNDRCTDLPTPIRIEWEGKARTRIAADCQQADRDSADQYLAVHERFSTQIEMQSVAEARAVITELTRATTQIRWEDATIQRSLARVRDRITAALAERGIEQLGERCARCGEPYVIADHAGPGETRTGCGCVTQPELVTDGGTIDCCPECGSGRVRTNSHGVSGPSVETDHTCKECGAAFNELAERSRERASGGRRGLAGRLADPDVGPEDLSQEEESELITDGGRQADSVDGIRDRPSPRTMALPCLWAEIDDLAECVSAADEAEFAAIQQRFQALSHWLRARLDIEYPECPACGEPVQRGEDGTPVCSAPQHDLPEEVIEAYERADGRLWGTRGHNGGAR